MGVDNFDTTLREAVAISRLAAADVVRATVTWRRETTAREFAASDPLRRVLRFQGKAGDKTRLAQLPRKRPRAKRAADPPAIRTAVPTAPYRHTTSAHTARVELSRNLPARGSVDPFG